ncbi:hypothetical protein [Ruegeria atlantica]|uniref:hypothetical protein n=1 Tax=Ruegeria atlantica TaxID=81569 RepID=UPI001481D07C|nr:hypothetical protein [Ruegeria atlantica]
MPDGLSYLTPDVWQAVQVFGADMDRIAAIHASNVQLASDIPSGGSNERGKTVSG